MIVIMMVKLMYRPLLAGYFPNEDPKYSVVVITPNISHNNGTNDTMYYGASKITKEITSFLADNY